MDTGSSDEHNISGKEKTHTLKKVYTNLTEAYNLSWVEEELRDPTKGFLVANNELLLSLLLKKRICKVALGYVAEHITL